MSEKINTSPRIASTAALLALALLSLPALAARQDAPAATPVAAGEAPAVPAMAASAALRPFTAVLAVAWKGISAGISTLELSRSGPDAWKYSSRSEARGLARMFVPGDITQTSHLSIVDGRVRPLQFRGDDGTADDSRDISLDFDWQRNRVTGIAERKAVSLELRPGAQDDLSAQIATMLQLAQGGSLPPTFSVVDKNEIKEYRYRQEGTARLHTAVGDVDTIVVSSQRNGSPRTLRTWFAPSLGFVPVKAERARAGNVEFSMEIRSLKR